MTFSLRPATSGDQTAIQSVLFRSVRELCGADHRNDEEIIHRWCRNKTIETIAEWIRATDEFYLVVAMNGDEKIVGVGKLAVPYREIRLCYISPDAVGKGVGRLILTALEKFARRSGMTEVRLTSTSTALQFYRSNGYDVDGEPVSIFGIQGYPLVKRLVE